MDGKERNYNLDQATIHANNYSVLVDQYRKMISQCIDGRYLHEDNEAVSIPGADGGQLQVMLVSLKSLLKIKKLDIEDINTLEKILIEVVGGIENLRFHTDERNSREFAIGCKHLRLVDDYPYEYDLLVWEMEKVKNFINKMEAKGAKNVMLKGEHDEKALFMVNSESHYVCNQDDDGNQVFVYHKTFAQNRNGIIAKRMKNEVPSLIDNDGVTEGLIKGRLNEIMERHMSKTSGKLPKGLPIFNVSIDEDDTKVGYQGFLE